MPLDAPNDCFFGMELRISSRKRIRRQLLFLVCFGALAAVGAYNSAAQATPPSRVKVTGVNRDALLASARKHLNDEAIKVLTATIDENADANEKLKPPLVGQRNSKIIFALIDISKLALARGERDKVERLFAEITRGRLIHGSGQFYTMKVDPKTHSRNSRGYGGRMVIELELRGETSSGFNIVVFYRLLDPPVVFGEKREGPRYAYPVGR